MPTVNRFHSKRPHEALRRIGQAVALPERALMGLASLVMLTIMVVIVVDVTRRYLFNAPVPWAFDLISLYLMAAMFFFSVSDTLRYNRHVNVDLFQAMMPPRWRSACNALNCLVALLLFGLLAGQGAQRAWAAFEAGDRLVGSVPWPTWLYYSFVPIGSALIGLRLAARLVGHCIAAASGDDSAEQAVAASEGESHHGRGAQGA